MMKVNNAKLAKLKKRIKTVNESLPDLADFVADLEDTWPPSLEKIREAKEHILTIADLFTLLENADILLKINNENELEEGRDAPSTGGNT